MAVNRPCFEFCLFFIPLRIVNWIIRALRETEKVLETIDCENTSRSMSKLVFVVICMLAAVNAYSANGRRKYAEGKPSMLWERGIIPEYEDNPDVYRDTAWLLDRIMMDEAQVLHDDEFEPPSVKYRHGSGDKQECINGAKSIPYNCQWTGWVVLKEDGEPEQLKLTVSNKYCNRDGQTKPHNEIVEC